MRLRIGKATKARLHQAVRAGRRETVYKMTAKRLEGFVPCFVCGRHVKDHHATLEHKVQVAHGGTDDMSNLAISHGPCNHRRGDSVEMVCEGARYYE